MYNQGGGILEEFKNVYNRGNNSHIQLILINLVVFLVLIISNVFLDLLMGTEAFEFVLTQLAMPSNIDKFIVKPWTLVTYMFVHLGFFHIFFNMLFLYWFGKLIQEYLGSAKVISLYIIGGIAGGIMYILLYNTMGFYADRVDSSILFGASAGVFAIVVGSATLMPNHTFYLMFIGAVRIKYIAIFYVILSFASITGSNAGGELAHLGGAMVGFFFIKQLNQGVDWSKSVMGVIGFFKSFFSKQSKIKVSYSSRKSKSEDRQTNKSKSAKTDQEEIDHILDKISQAGYESLTKEEKQKLFNASKK